AILRSASGAKPETVRSTLEASGGRTQVALVMLIAGVGKAKAMTALEKSCGHVRAAIAIAKR
ncbi:MAG: hypothetical protein WCC95_15875, partial [Candidatus Sulfotelmatobacter sp.]